MLEALVEAGIAPDMVLGTSVGALNGAAFAARPDAGGVARLREVWTELGTAGLLDESLVGRLRTVAATGTALHRTDELAAVARRLLDAGVGIEDLDVRFSCVAACIETAAAVWFTEGPLLQALLASSAVPGLFPPVAIDGRHYVDGGLVDSIPVRRAVHAGARTVFVLQVGRIEQQLEPPTNLLRVAVTSFEIARRHGFSTFMQDVPADVTVHVLPSGGAAPAPTDLRAAVAYRDTSGLGGVMDAARDASRSYLADTIGAVS